MTKCLLFSVTWYRFVITSLQSDLLNECLNECLTTLGPDIILYGIILSELKHNTEQTKKQIFSFISSPLSGIFESRDKTQFVPSKCVILH